MQKNLLMEPFQEKNLAIIIQFRTNSASIDSMTRMLRACSFQYLNKVYIFINSTKGCIANPTSAIQNNNQKKKSRVKKIHYFLSIVVNIIFFNKNLMDITLFDMLQLSGSSKKRVLILNDSSSSFECYVIMK